MAQSSMPTTRSYAGEKVRCGPDDVHVVLFNYHSFGLETGQAIETDNPSPIPQTRVTAVHIDKTLPEHPCLMQHDYAMPVTVFDTSTT